MVLCILSHCHLFPLFFIFYFLFFYFLFFYLEDEADSDAYFSKYLTSPKLLHLETQDPHFRRQILIQILIFLQSLPKASVKPQAPKVEAPFLEARVLFYFILFHFILF